MRKKHNTLLHFRQSNSNENITSATQYVEDSIGKPINTPSNTEELVGHWSNSQNLVLLSTAHVLIFSDEHKPIQC